MREEHYIRLPAQGNIYSTTRLGHISLIGTGTHGKVFAHKKKEVLEIVPLLDLPKVNADIIAVDACDDPIPILAVTYVDTTNSTLEDEIKPAYLQIYSGSFSSKSEYAQLTERSEDSNRRLLMSTSSGSGTSPLSSPVSTFTFSRSVADVKVKERQEYICKQLEIIGSKAAIILSLNFMPYHLCNVLAQNSRGDLCTLFLLSGSDRRIHLFEPTVDETTDTITYAEVPTRNYFPELPAKFDAIVTRIAIQFTTATKTRVTLCGLEDGTLLCYIMSEAGIPKFASIMNESTDSSDTSTTDLNSTSVTSLPEDNVLTDKEKFQLTSSTSSETKSQLTLDDNIVKIVNHYSGMITCIKFYNDGVNTNAVVSSSASPAYHYINVLEEKFKLGSPLKFSARWDCVQSVCVADIDFDGENEILVGTSASTLLVYKYLPGVQNWAIVAHSKLTGAIFSIAFFNFYIHVVTTRGLHIMEFSNAAHYLKYGLVVSEDKAQKSMRDYELEKSIEELKLSTRTGADDL